MQLRAPTPQSRSRRADVGCRAAGPYTAMHRIIRSWPVVGLVAALTVVAMVSPASAQYAGSERGFIVSPLRVPAGSDLSGLGSAVPPIAR